MTENPEEATQAPQVDYAKRVFNSIPGSVLIEIAGLPLEDLTDLKRLVSDWNASSENILEPIFNNYRHIREKDPNYSAWNSSLMSEVLVLGEFLDRAITNRRVGCAVLIPNDHPDHAMTVRRELGKRKSHGFNLSSLGSAF